MSSKQSTLRGLVLTTGLLSLFSVHSIASTDTSHGSARLERSGISLPRKNYLSTQCAACHGADGKGPGPVKQYLKHAPTDLNHHLHMGPGEGGAHLTWSDHSEGAQAETALPAPPRLKKNQLDDVLSFIHQAFHHRTYWEELPDEAYGETPTQEVQQRLDKFQSLHHELQLRIYPRT